MRPFRVRDAIQVQMWIDRLIAQQSQARA